MIGTYPFLSVRTLPAGVVGVTCLADASLVIEVIKDGDEN